MLGYRSAHAGVSAQHRCLSGTVLLLCAWAAIPIFLAMLTGCDAQQSQVAQDAAGTLLASLVDGLGRALGNLLEAGTLTLLV